MKKIIVLLHLFIIPALGYCQSIIAQYEITEDNTIATGKVGENKTVTLNYTGYLYKKNNRYIFFEKPAYLSKVKDGGIWISNPQDYSNVIIYSVNTDTMQFAFYCDYDSLLQRHFYADKENYISHFEPGLFAWDLLPETKEINGLRCQKTTRSYNGKVQTIVWFCPDIPMQGGIFNVLDIPGLVVEAEFPEWKNRHYLLINHAMNAEFSDTVFWPKEFDKTFIWGSDWKKNQNQKQSKPNKTAKQLDILNNNQ